MGSTSPTLEPELEELRDLLRRRRQLVEQRVQELGRVDKVVSLAVAESTSRHISWLEAEIEVLDREYQEKIQSSPTLAQRTTLYRTVPGVGKLTAAILVAHLPELGLLDARPLLPWWAWPHGPGTADKRRASGPFEVAVALFGALCTFAPGQ